MAIMQRANKQLTVDENSIESYLAEGYDQIDASGKIIKNATNNKTINYQDHLKEVAELKGKIAKLEKKSK